MRSQRINNQCAFKGVPQRYSSLIHFKWSSIDFLDSKFLKEKTQMQRKICLIIFGIFSVLSHSAEVDSILKIPKII